MRFKKICFLINLKKKKKSILQPNTPSLGYLYLKTARSAFNLKRKLSENLFESFLILAQLSKHMTGWDSCLKTFASCPGCIYTFFSALFSSCKTCLPQVKTFVFPSPVLHLTTWNAFLKLTLQHCCLFMKYMFSYSGLSTCDSNQFTLLTDPT